ncbi:hypothetical protein Tco_0273496, partial [Tanacetum coccineum]
DTIKLEDVVATLNSRKLQKMTEAKGDGGEGFYVSGRSGQRDMEQMDCPRYNHKKSEGFVKNDQVSSYGAMGNAMYGETCKVQVQIRDRLSFVLDNVRIKVKKGSLMVLSGTRRSICVYTLDGQALTRNTLKGRKQLGEYQTRWKIKTGNVLDSYNQRSTQQCMKSGVAKHLGVSGLSKVFWAEDTTMSTYLVNRSPSSVIGFKTPIDMLGFFGWLASIKQGMLEPVVLYRNMGFNESGEYKKTFIGSGVAGLQEVQTQDLIYYHPARDREQHSAWELFSYREDSNEAAFTVAKAEKIYAHESLTFNNTVACEVISQWKAGLKDDMDARSDVYVLSNGYRKCSDDNDAEIWVTKGLLVKAKGNVLGMEIVRDQSGDCDVEKNGKWSCIYAVGSQEYQMVCTRLDIASADVDQSQAGYMTLTEASKEAIRLKGLAIESGFELKIIAGIATGALSKAIPSPRFQYRLKLLHIKDF